MRNSIQDLWHRVSLLLLAGVAALATPAFGASTSLVTLNTRPGVTQKFILIQPDQPVGAVILFAGGIGLLALSVDNAGIPVIGAAGGNFLVRTRSQYAARGLTVAVVDAPSDRQSTAGMDFNFRKSAEHAVDIGAVVGYLKNPSNLPVWVVGTSAGTTSAANSAIRLGDAGGGVSGMVLSSGLAALSYLTLAAVQVPSLVLHHDQDACPSTSPASAQANYAALTAPIRQLTFLTGGLPPTSDPCLAFSPHGFYGIETQAVDVITGFVLAHGSLPSVSTLPAPGAPLAGACSAAADTLVSSDWRLSRPLGLVVTESQATVHLQSAPFSAAVDVYLIISVPGGLQFAVNSAGQILPFPANIVPLRANSAAALASQPLFSVPLSAIPSGSYSFQLVVVPAGTNPATFSIVSSPYYLWCFTRNF